MHSNKRKPAIFSIAEWFFQVFKRVPSIVNFVPKIFIRNWLCSLSLPASLYWCIFIFFFVNRIAFKWLAVHRSSECVTNLRSPTQNSILNRAKAERYFRDLIYYRTPFEMSLLVICISILCPWLLLIGVLLITMMILWFLDYFFHLQKKVKKSIFE